MWPSLQKVSLLNKYRANESEWHVIESDDSCRVTTDKSTTTIKTIYSPYLAKKEIDNFMKMSKLGIGPHVMEAKKDKGRKSYIKMEYFPKKLKAYLKEKGSDEGVLPYVSDKLFSLLQEMLTSGGTFCRYINCDNVLVDDRRDEPKIVLTDLGSDCKVLDQRYPLPLLMMLTMMSISVYETTRHELFLNYVETLYYIFRDRHKFLSLQDPNDFKVPDEFDKILLQYQTTKSTVCNRNNALFNFLEKTGLFPHAEADHNSEKVKQAVSYVL